MQNFLGGIPDQDTPIRKRKPGGHIQAAGRQKEKFVTPDMRKYPSDGTRTVIRVSVGYGKLASLYGHVSSLS
jgi:hypothetical protein